MRRCCLAEYTCFERHLNDAAASCGRGTRSEAPAHGRVRAQNGWASSIHHTAMGSWQAVQVCNSSRKKKARMPAASLASCDGTGARILRGAGTVTAGLNSRMIFRDCRARGYLQCFSGAANHGENSTPPEKLRHPGKCSPGTVNREGPVTS